MKKYKITLTIRVIQLTVIFSLLLIAANVSAHPVSFKDSTGVMGYHSPMLVHNQINYSFRHWLAAGIHHVTRPSVKGGSATFASGNFLLKRWNGSGFQANIYSILGAGVSNMGGTSEASGLGLLQFDIENRNYYFLAKHLGIMNDKRSDLEQTVIRLGLSPYVEKFDGIHSWLILEWQQSQFSDGSRISDLTPFLRVFYKNLLFEIGQSFDGVTKFNYITHF